jgi:hypothetical protein
MLKIMMCGASDMAEVSNQFKATTQDLGGEPLYYTEGRIKYLNSATSSWTDNSLASIAEVDLCIFVAIRRYGEITWTTELREALRSGKPFLILCLKSTYDAYYALDRSLPDFSAISDPEQRKLFSMLHELRLEWKLTMVPFDHGDFREVYRREASALFLEGLRGLEKRFQRESLARLLGDPARLSNSDLVAAEETALDEIEDKNLRKAAIRALAERGAASPSTVTALIGSSEQGVQRLVVQLLPNLYKERPADPEFLADCVARGNESDDVGILRRLIPSLLELDTNGAIQAFEGLDLSEIGTRRRLASELEKYEHWLTDPTAKTAVAELLARCAQSTSEVGWLARCKAFRSRLLPPQTEVPA